MLTIWRLPVRATPHAPTLTGIDNMTANETPLEAAANEVLNAAQEARNRANDVGRVALRGGLRSTTFANVDLFQAERLLRDGADYLAALRKEITETAERQKI